MLFPLWGDSRGNPSLSAEGGEAHVAVGEFSCLEQLRILLLGLGGLRAEAAVSVTSAAGQGALAPLLLSARGPSVSSERAGFELKHVGGGQSPFSTPPCAFLGS